MNTLKTIYLTIIHTALAIMVFLYTNDTWVVSKIDHPVAKAECCNGDELTAFLTSQQGKGSHHGH